MKESISIVIPCYNEEETVLPCYKSLLSVMNTIRGCDIELLFVNDGSRDQTLQKLRGLAEKDNRVHYLSLSRNFGKESAMFAGFCNASSDYVAVMDADLQDPPEILVQMLDILRKGEYDCVATRRTDRRGEPPVRSWFARKFYRLINRLTEVEVVDGARDFRMMIRKMVNALVAMDEYNRFSKGLFGWVGFRTYWLPYQNRERIAGKTKWNFRKLFNYALDGIMDFSQAPLDLASWLGLVMTLISIVAILFIVIRKLVIGDPVAGWPSMACIIILTSGVQLFCLGIIGKYLAKVYTEVKHRPHFIVDESNVNHAKLIG